MLTAEERALVSAANAVKARERKAAKAARRPNPKADRGRVRDNGYLAFLRRQACAVGPAGCGGPTDAAHIRSHRPGERPTGMGRKPDDRRATPLCRNHHTAGPDAQHNSNEMAWWAAHGLNPFDVADKLFAQYQAAA